MSEWIDKLNEPQIESIIELKKIINGAHYIDLCVRIDGQNRYFEADWVKQLLNQTDFNR